MTKTTAQTVALAMATVALTSVMSSDVYADRARTARRVLGSEPPMRAISPPTPPPTRAAPDFNVINQRLAIERVQRQMAERLANDVRKAEAASRVVVPPPLPPPPVGAKAQPAASDLGLTTARDASRRVAGQTTGKAREVAGAKARDAEEKLAVQAAQARKHSAQRAFEEVRDPGVIYARFDKQTKAPYVGQAKNSKRYESRQGEHDRKEKASHSYYVIATGPKSRLPLLEEHAIRSGGGPRGKQANGMQLRNSRVEMKQDRYEAAGGMLKELAAKPKSKPTAAKKAATKPAR